MIRKVKIEDRMRRGNKNILKTHKKLLILSINRETFP